MPEQLADVRNLALVVRLTLAADGRLVHGEILDVHGQSCGQCRTWTELTAALQECAGAGPHPSSPPVSI